MNRTMFYNMNITFVEHLQNIQLFAGYNNNNNNTLFQTIVHMDNKKNK